MRHVFGLMSVFLVACAGAGEVQQANENAVTVLDRNLLFALWQAHRSHIVLSTHQLLHVIPGFLACLLPCKLCCGHRGRHLVIVWMRKY
jgi:hypothetical protein